MFITAIISTVCFHQVTSIRGQQETLKDEKCFVITARSEKQTKSNPSLSSPGLYNKNPNDSQMASYN